MDWVSIVAGLLALFVGVVLAEIESRHRTYGNLLILDEARTALCALAATEWYVAASEGMVVDRVVRLERLAALELAGRSYPRPRPLTLGGSLADRPAAKELPRGTIWTATDCVGSWVVRDQSWVLSATKPPPPRPSAEETPLLGGPADGEVLKRADFVQGYARVAIPGASATYVGESGEFPLLREQGLATYRLERAPDMEGWVGVYVSSD